MSIVAPDIPGFVGFFNGMAAPNDKSVFVRGGLDYDLRQYQYGLSSNVDHVNPAIIAYPKDENDIAAAIKFAKERKISVAIRTGGHQYCAASSTTGDNMQLDLSRSFQTFEDIGDFEIYRKVRVGVSFALSDFIKTLQADKKEKSAQYPNGKPGYFIPTGICSHVHIGGHCQTGGYGQLGRAFGLFGDHIRTVEFVDANGQIRSVTRGEGTQDDKDLFYAILGGSPGNFGVITHVTLLLRKDEYHPQSRGLKMITFYTKEILQQLLDVKALMANPTEKDPEIGGGLDFCITVLGGTMSMWNENHGIDEEFRLKHRTWFGSDDNPNLIRAKWPKSIVIYAQWADTDGAARNPNDLKNALKWMDKVRNIGKGKILHPHWTVYNQHDKTPMSVLAQAWVFTHVREFDLPYHKRCYFTNSTTLVEDNWAKWAADRIDAAMQNDDLKLAVQIQNFGGQTSKYRINGETGDTAYSWRKDSNICSTMDAFYDDNVDKKVQAEAAARAWVEENDLQTLPDGKFKVDRRLLWASYGEYDMDKAKLLYFEDEQKYQNIARIRLKADPTGLFAANTFCVGWDQVPGKLVGKGAAIVPHAAGARLNLRSAAPPVALTLPVGFNERDMINRLKEFNPVHVLDSNLDHAVFSGDFTAEEEAEKERKQDEENLLDQEKEEVVGVKEVVAQGGGPLKRQKV